MRTAASLAPADSKLGLGVVAKAATFWACALCLAASVLPGTGWAAANGATTGADGVAYQWRAMKVGGGGFIMSQSSSRDGSTRVVRTDTYGAYVWDGQLWQQLVNARSMPAGELQPEANAQGVAELVVAPSQPSLLYMQFRGGIYRSDDRGGRWTRTPFASVAMNPNDDYRAFGPRLAVQADQPQWVLAGTQRDGLWQSLNGGSSWQRIGAVPAGLDDRPDVAGEQGPGVLVWFNAAARTSARSAPLALALSYGNGFYTLLSDRRTWGPLRNDGVQQPRKLSHGDFAADGSFYGAGRDGVWRWRQGQWRLISPFVSDWVSVAVDPLDSNRVLAFNGGGAAYRSLDGGSSWTPLARTVVTGSGDVPWLSWIDNSYFTTAQVVFDRTQPGRLWASGGAGVYRADISNGSIALQWVTETRGIEQLVANDVVAPPGGAPVLAGWDFGLRVADSPDSYALTHGPFRRFNSVWQVDWSPSTPGFLVANTSDHRFCCNDDGGAVQAGYSQDGGRSWTRFASLPRPPGTEASDAWAFSFGSIAVAADSANNIVWLPSFNRPPYYTLDRGANWSRIVLPGEPANAPGSHFAFFLSRKTLAADRVLPRTFYYAHSGAEGDNGALKGLWRSTDGGATWQRRYSQNIGRFDVFNAQLKAVPGQAGHLFHSSGPLDGLDDEFRRSTDGGQTWTVVTDIARVSAFGFGKAAAGAAYPAIYLAGLRQGNYGLWRSTDNAASWQRMGEWPADSLDQVTAVDGDKDVFGRVYLGFRGSGWAVGEDLAQAGRAADRR